MYLDICLVTVVLFPDSLVPRHLTRLCVRGRFGCVELYVVGRVEGESEEGR